MQKTICQLLNSLLGMRGSPVAQDAVVFEDSIAHREIGCVENKPEHNPAAAITGNGETGGIARSFLRQTRARMRVSEIAGLKLLIIEHVQLVSGRLARSAPRSAKRQTRRMRESNIVSRIGWREKGTGQRILLRIWLIDCNQHSNFSPSSKAGDQRKMQVPPRLKRFGMTWLKVKSKIS
jgi:hypothetical protein